ncbi:MAG: hypothetical protein JSV04_07805 [Candidatus Heimdallarchaeota archaeon]|nr:MAG: hypothetical protein JSV04_07805 [Candidatus Heimdallarchaeota archaeon]
MLVFSLSLFFLDPLALFVGTIFPDIEGITAVFILPGKGLPLHGPLHSFTGAFLSGIIVAFCSWFAFKMIFPTLVEQLQLDLPFSLPEYSFKRSLLSAQVSTISHIILDAPLYGEMDLLYPLGVGNSWYGLVPGSLIYLLCVLSFFLGGTILILRVGLTRSS